MNVKPNQLFFGGSLNLRFKIGFLRRVRKELVLLSPQTSIALTVNKAPAVLLFIRESHVYSKRQTPDSRREFLRMENKQIKTARTILMDKTGVKLLIFVQK